jgi:cell division protein FtsB
VGAASGKNALVSPQILAALAEARSQMQQAREDAASASGNAREAADRAGDAVDALNVAAYGLLRSREDVSGASSGSGFAEAMQRMTQLAKQQGQLSQDASGLLPMLGSNALQQQLQSLAARQRALAQELERLRAQGQADAKPLGDEARDLARELERGRLDRETVTRQERLFRRMLDAGRTLQGQDEDQRKERQSETAKNELQLPPALRAELLGRGGIKLPTWEQLQKLSPEERRLVTDYFRRLTGGNP